MRKMLLALVAGLVLVPAAAAGGTATVQLSSVPTDGMKAGSTLGIDITVLQHGETPLDGVAPVFQILDLESGEIVREVEGTPTGRPGVYHVDVSFPREGTFAYQVYDGFTEYGGAQTHTYDPVDIVGAGGSARPAWLIPLLAVVGLLLLGGVIAAFVRRSRPEPALP